LATRTRRYREVTGHRASNSSHHSVEDPRASRSSLPSVGGPRVNRNSRRSVSSLLRPSNQLSEPLLVCPVWGRTKF
jgi:hypothetical protein